jgi:hypothetical protein
LVVSGLYQQATAQTLGTHRYPHEALSGYFRHTHEAGAGADLHLLSREDLLRL